MGRGDARCGAGGEGPPASGGWSWRLVGTMVERMERTLLWMLLLAGAPLLAQKDERQLAHDILKELIEINTTDSVGDNTRAAEAMSARFRAAGFADADLHVLAPAPRKGNVIVRMRGTGAMKPILFMGHLDVVEARREDSSFDPVKLVEQDGWLDDLDTQDMSCDD